VAALVAVAAFGGTAVAAATPDDDALRAGLEADLTRIPGVPGEALAVRAPGVRVDLAVGLADPTTGAALRPDTPFRVASMTKAFVAAAVLRLVEQGELRLTDPISRHLSDESLAVLRTDGYDVDAITVRQLLQHTSGLFDYALDDDYFAAGAADPAHRWTRLEQLQFATAHGDPLGPPGAQFAYGDTGYVLLGEILERTTGETLPAAVRRLDRFDRLGLRSTYWETLESAPPGLGPRAIQFYGDYSNANLDPSTDLYGGGGLVSTVGDLTRFFRALFHGKVFERPASLRTMTHVPAVSRDDQAAMGLYVVDAAGERCYGHRGFWGTQTIHCPDLDVTYARTINQALNDGFDSNPLEATIVETVRAASTR
jgi:D-alanyl-D-alanine carboxypeptidase